jgi:hypothetical protein
MPSNTTQITPPRVPLTDERTGAVSREWYRWFYNQYTVTGGGTGVTPVINGGTGLSTIPTNGQLLIGNGTGYTLNTLGVGAGITVTNAAGTITVANSGVLSNLAGIGISVSSATGNVTVSNTGVLSILAGTGISRSGATGNVTISNTGVLSFSSGTTGLTPAAATAGAVTLAGTLGVPNGGSGAVTLTGYVKGNATAAFTASATIPNTDITGLGTISVKNTGASGSFTTVDLKTVTVTDGIITSIV